MTDTPAKAEPGFSLSRRDMVFAAAGTAAAALIPAAAMAQTVSMRAGRKALIINAHQIYPGISEGRLNRSLVSLMATELQAKGFEVRETAIAQGYDVTHEQEKHLWADVIIVQSPAFWLATPWIYKKYIDDVFTAGMVAGTFLSGDGRPAGQYGSGGKLQDKQFMLSLTMNAPRQGFADPAQRLFAGRTLDDVFFPASAPYRFCGVDILPAFACFDVMRNPDVANDFARLRATLNDHFS